MKKIERIIWGFFFLIVGVIVLLNTLGITNINLFFKGWWTFFIIVPSFIGIVTDDNPGGSLVAFIVGILFFMTSWDLLDIDLLCSLLFPIMLIFVGLSILIKTSDKNVIRGGENNKRYVALFSGQDLNFDGEFAGSNLDAVFGGIECDLSNAKVKNKSIIHANAIFGGITIYVPEDVTVKVSSMPIFGGVSDDRKKKCNDSKKILYISSTVIFGGLEIK